VHDYKDIMPNAISIMMHGLNEIADDTEKQLQTHSETRLVKNLQAVEWAKTCAVVGLISTFEAHLKDEFEIADNYAFNAVDTEFRSNDEAGLADALAVIINANNALKHGDGRSYRALLKENNLTFGVRLPDQAFFEEGDVAEVATLIKVDGKFISHCIDTILATLRAMRKIRGLD